MHLQRCCSLIDGSHNAMHHQPASPRAGLVLPATLLLAACCRLGRGILLDHGTGVVIGETAVIGNNCSILQNVTLGGTGKEVRGQK